MGLTDTQKDIEGAIRYLSERTPPFATVADIAEYTGYTEQTIRNNADTVLEERAGIGSVNVDRTTVYFESNDQSDKIWQEGTRSVAHLTNPRTEAWYVEIREAPDSSDFDYEAHWYDDAADELEGYNPPASELGRAVEGYGATPVSIKLYDESQASPLEADNL
ncbi:hypothetical protein ACOJIV_20640 [Haloarcula sp. AONF1]